MPQWLQKAYSIALERAQRAVQMDQVTQEEKSPPAFGVPPAPSHTPSGFFFPWLFTALWSLPPCLFHGTDATMEVPLAAWFLSL